MEKISCSIAKDLMPLYMDGVLSAETTEVMKAHLESCGNCRKEYETMEQEWKLPSSVRLQEENKKMLKELKHQIKRKNPDRGCGSFSCGHGIGWRLSGL